MMNNKTNNTEALNLSIIGGGPAAVSLLLQFIREIRSFDLKGKINIDVFEKTEKIGYGTPYAYKEDDYILNLPKDVMEPISGQNGTFSQWIKQTNKIHQETQFPPRYYFGEYLAHVWNHLLIEANTLGINVNAHLNTDVLNVKQTEDERFLLKTTQGRHISDYLVLCTGHMESDLYHEFTGKNNYQHIPWNQTNYNNIETLGIIGSRLTAIDYTLKSSSDGFDKRMIMFSRSGLLPAVLSKKVPSHQLKYLTIENCRALRKEHYLPLENLMELFWMEISYAEGKNINFDNIIKSKQDMSTLEWLDKEIYHAEACDKYWQYVLFAIYPSMPEIWNMLSSEDKQQFMDNYHSLLMIYLPAFPLENAYKIRELVKTGQLEVHGDLSTIQYDPINERYHVQCAKQSSQMQVDYLVNASGAGHNLTKNPLYHNLLKSGLVESNPLGGGRINFHTSQVIVNGEKNNSLYMVGDLTNGDRLLTSDMLTTTHQAGTVATHLANSIKNRPIYRQKNGHNTYSSQLSGHFFPKKHPASSLNINKHKTSKNHQPIHYNHFFKKSFMQQTTTKISQMSTTIIRSFKP